MATYVDSSEPSISSSQRDPTRARVKLRALLICDLVDSTVLVDELGDRAAAELIRKHDRLARDLFHLHGGQEIDKSDGFLTLFKEPGAALQCALDYQRELKRLSAEAQRAMHARVGIHYGEIVLYQNTREDIAQGAKPLEAEGIAKPIAARLMGAAMASQILLTRGACDLARRSPALLDSLDRVQFREHGRYQIKGLVDPLDVFEAGELGIAPLRAPQKSAKAKRVSGWSNRALAVTIALLTLAILAGFVLNR